MEKRLRLRCGVFGLTGRAGVAKTPPSAGGMALFVYPDKKPKLLGHHYSLSSRNTLASTCQLGHSL